MISAHRFWNGLQKTLRNKANFIILQKFIKYGIKTGCQISCGKMSVAKLDYGVWLKTDKKLDARV